MARLAALIVLFCLYNVAYADHGNGILLHTKKQAHSVSLSKKERAWLAAHKTIRLAFDGSLPPYSFKNKSGKYEGIAVDIMNALSREMGIRFKIHRNSNWVGIYKAAATGKIDVIATMVDRPERRLWFNFTEPYLTKSLVIMTHKDNTSIKNRDDLAGKKIALPVGYYFGDQVKKEFPSIKPYFVDTLFQGLKVVSQNKADAAVTFMATANYFQLKKLITDLEFVDFYDRNSADESIAIRKDWPILARILQKGLDSLSEDEINAIFTKWVPPSVPVPTIVTVPPLVSTTVENNLVSPSPTQSILNLDWEISPPIGLVSAFLLAWIFKLRRHNNKLRLSCNYLQISNRESKEFQNSLEQLVLKRTAQLKASELKFRNLVENQSNEYFFFQHDCNGVFTYISPSITKILGYSADEFMKHYFDYLTDNPINKQVAEYIALSTQGIPNRPYQIEILDNMKTPHWLEVMDSPVYDDYGNCIGVDGVMHDITARKETNERLLWLSYYDDLTGLANRRLFMDRVQQTIHMAIRKRLSFSLMFLDMDGFKAVNDSMGHAAGDAILKEVASRMTSVLRDSDIASRFGGDEFALLLPETNKQSASLVAEKIVIALSCPYLLETGMVNLGASIGIAAYPEDSKTSEDLIKLADSAMYFAKKEQRGYAYVTDFKNKSFLP